MYFVDKNGVKNIDTNKIIGIGSTDWDEYKKWIIDGNTPEFDPLPYEYPQIIILPKEE